MKKILILIFSLFVCLNCFTGVSAENSQKVVDEPDYLSSNEEETINNLINNYINKTNFDMVVYITENVGTYFDEYDENEAITRLADDYYDNNGYGIGEDKNGLIMCIVFGEKTIGYNAYTITTCGSACIDTYTDYALSEMYSYIDQCLSEGDLASAAKEFTEVAECVYDNYDYYHNTSDIPDPDIVTPSNTFVDAIAPAFIGAIVVALVYFLILRGQLKNTGIKHTAGNYMSDQNINISRSGEIYLYTTRKTHKIERSEPSSSHSSNSSIHTSSSGTSHGGGGSHRF